MAIFTRNITERKRAEEALRQQTAELEELTRNLGQRVQERTAELEKANQTLQELSSRLLSAQEDERKRIAGELHDTIGSCLSGVKFKIQNVLQQIGKDSNITEESLSSIIPVVQEGIEECRRMQQDLRPSILDDLGLLATLSWFCRRFETIYSHVRTEQTVQIDEGEIPNGLKIVIYRVAQEAMNNVAKHSKADLVRLSLQKTDGKMELTIRDNGQGFNPEKVIFQEGTKRGLGLSSMKERTELSGGFFAVESVEGKGTTIRASWPL
jgi:signal transduction histidine kinase